MHYLDPDRPRLGGPNSLPLLQGAHAKCVLPGLYVSPRGTPDNVTMEVSVFLPFATGGASRREITLSPDQFLDFWAKWLADPEGVAKDIFKWEAEKPLPLALDLDDLLDF
jgi:hypothetical protein